MKWEEMTPDERNMLIARRGMGLQVWRGTLHLNNTPTGEALLYCEGPDGGRLGLPAYTTDIVAARLVEDEIERRGLVDAYIDALAVLIDPNGNDISIFDTIIEMNGRRALWALLRATPEQRCWAALRAMGVEV